MHKGVGSPRSVPEASADVTESLRVHSCPGPTQAKTQDRPKHSFPEYFSDPHQLGQLMSSHGFKRQLHANDILIYIFSLMNSRISTQYAYSAVSQTS